RPAASPDTAPAPASPAIRAVLHADGCALDHRRGYGGRWMATAASGAFALGSAARVLLVSARGDATPRPAVPWAIAPGSACSRLRLAWLYAIAARQRQRASQRARRATGSNGAEPLT